ncbi:hypothetical protein TNCV_3380421 [Trichonephila clavipes]|nr:hypothetical protein TNCV_3380421 [Trichonephila clavipes]
MATGSYLTPNYSRSQSEIQGDLHKLYDVLLVKRNIVTLQQENASSAVNAKSGGMRNVPIMKMSFLSVTIVSCTQLNTSALHYNALCLI